MRFYCKPDMTSSWFLRQGSLHAILHNGFWQSDHDFQIAFHSNFLSGMHGFQENEVLLQAGYDVIVISPQGAIYAILHDGIWKSDHDFLIAFHNNFSSGMHIFRDNKVSLPTGYDVIVIFPLGSSSGDFYDWFWNSDHDFLIAFHSNFLSVMYSFRDEKLFLKAGYDVNVISPLGGAPGDFSWRILKKRSWLPDSVLQ